MFTPRRQHKNLMLTVAADSIRRKTLRNSSTLDTVSVDSFGLPESGAQLT